MNQSELANELHRYINAMRHEEPPDPIKVEDSDPGSSERGDHSVEDQGEEESELSPAQQLAELENEAEGCPKCDLSENRTQVVFADGSVEAEIMVIGEAPGADEDREGYPFVGRAGELLRGGFDKIGLEENKIYITNTVKCRPPDNRDPRQEELDACRPYLDRQIDIIDPPVILTLGNFALQYCLGDDRRITRSRGEVYDWNDRSLVPTYHPAYILRNRNEAQTFIDDLKLASRQLGE